MIRYKVVNEFRGSCYMNFSSHRLFYKKGMRVEKAEGSIGIFVFDTLENAQQFVSDNNIFSTYGKWEIIRVEAHGKGTRMIWRPTNFGSHSIQNVPYYFNKFKNKISKDKGKIPFMSDEFYHYFSRKNDGTMVYDAVTPID